MEINTKVFCTSVVGSYKETFEAKVIGADRKVFIDVKLNEYGHVFHLKYDEEKDAYIGEFIGLNFRSDYDVPYSFRTEKKKQESVITSIPVLKSKSGLPERLKQKKNP